MDHIQTAVDGLSCSHIVSVLTVDVNTQSAANWGAEVQRTEPEKEMMRFCMVNYHLACGSSAECVLTRASVFVWCSSLCVCVWMNRKREMSFGSIEAVWMWSREAKQQTHPEFKWILEKNEKKNLRVFTSQRRTVVCALRLSFITHSLTVTRLSIHPSIPTEYSRSPDNDKLFQLNITQGRNDLQVPLEVHLCIRYWLVWKQTRGKV